jgi:hypothetical protein
VVDLRVEVRQRVEEQVVRHRPREPRFFQRDAHLRRFVHAHPDGDDARLSFLDDLLYRLQHDDGRRRRRRDDQRLNGNGNHRHSSSGFLRRVARGRPTDYSASAGSPVASPWRFGFKIRTAKIALPLPDIQKVVRNIQKVLDLP